MNIIVQTMVEINHCRNESVRQTSLCHCSYIIFLLIICELIIIIIIIMVIFKCYFSGEHIPLSLRKNNNGVNIELGKTNRLKALCMMQINT